MTTETITWIPVTDQLPPRGTHVLVHAPASDDPIWLGFHNGEEWHAVVGDLYGAPGNAEGRPVVTHWAALPKGPG